MLKKTIKIVNPIKLRTIGVGLKPEKAKFLKSLRIDLVLSIVSEKKLSFLELVVFAVITILRNIFLIQEDGEHL
jgi:hypothetical protein